MLFALKLHADSQCPAVKGIEVELTRDASSIALRYRISGAVSELSIPPVTEARRMDELWRHTCCEAFIGIAGADEYREFNFSPSTAWAAYRFAAYRKDMTVELDVAEPKIDVRRDAHAFELRAAVGLRALAQPSRIGLSVVIEDRAGRISYWALKHPSKEESIRPDFHHPSSFIEWAT